MLKSYPKVLTLGDRYSADIFSSEVEVTEKVDGSQFGFGLIDGQLYMRSKGAQLFRESTDKLFRPAIEAVLQIEHELPEGITFYGETLCRPKHNTLAYGAVPTSNIVLFAALYADDSVVKDEDLEHWAVQFHMDRVPVLYKGMMDALGGAVDFVRAMLDRSSYLGGCQIEGVVIKNWYKPCMIGGMILPFMQAKYVSEKFKEVHQAGWTGENTTRGKWEDFKRTFKTEARWLKAVQHLRERGELEHSPRDIGKLINEVKDDITKEEMENIKDFLWNEFGKEVLRFSTGGLPEFYKEYLVKETCDAVEIP